MLWELRDSVNLPTNSHLPLERGQFLSPPARRKSPGCLRTVGAEGRELVPVSGEATADVW